MFQRAIPILDSFDVSNNYDLNQVIELSNIVQIVKSVECPTNITLEKFNEYRKETNAISRFVSSYFQQLDLSDIENIFQSIWTYYSLDMLELLERYKLLKKISDSSVQNLLDKKLVSLIHILKCEGWVKKYNQVITDYMMNNKEAAEIIIKYHLQEKFAKQENITFPKALTENKKKSILYYYIDGAFEPHPNYLELIENAPIIKGLDIDDKLRLKARRAKEKFWKNHISECSLIPCGCEAFFQEIDEIKDYYHDKEHNFDFYVYSKKWIREHQDFITLLNNFIDLFEFFDSELRCQFVSKKNNSLDAYLGINNGINHYPVNSQFRINQKIYLKILSAYIQELDEYRICLEDLFDHFFNVYLKENFGISDFEFKNPSKTTSLDERIKLLFIEIDSLIKQLKYYREDGCIDKDLMNISSKPVGIGELKSFLEQKYAYAKGKDLKDEMRFLFTFNLMFGMNFAWNGYESLAQIIAKEHLSINDFAKPAQGWINWLIERGSLRLKTDGSLGLNVVRCNLLYDLYENEVVCFAHQAEKSKEILENLKNTDEIDVGDTLFSRQEISYFNFVMNKKEFSNGMDLRNAFLHGSFRGTEQDSQHAYIEALKILIMIIFKANEEFCLKFPEIKQCTQEDLLRSLKNSGGVKTPNGGVNKKASGGVNLQDKILQEIKNNGGLNAPSLASRLSLSLRTVQRYLKQLTESKKIEFCGAPKNGGYYSR